jgi:hypothetical protein
VHFIIQGKNEKLTACTLLLIYKNILRLFLKKRYIFQISEHSYKCGKKMESAAIVDILHSIPLSMFV